MTGLPAGTPIEIWLQDEMRLGQENQRTRRWARRASQPRAVQDLRTGSVYLFGAICPERGTGTAVVLPRANTHAVQQHLDEIARTLRPGAHAIALLDHAGWHTTEKPRRPTNVTLVPLPPKSPEPNPVETLWRYLRQSYLSNRVLETSEPIVDAACHARTALIEQPWRIMSIGLRQWAQTSQS